MLSFDEILNSTLRVLFKISSNESISTMPDEALSPLTYGYFFLVGNSLENHFAKTIYTLNEHTRVRLSENHNLIYARFLVAEKLKFFGH